MTEQNFKLPTPEHERRTEVSLGSVRPGDNIEMSYYGSDEERHNAQYEISQAYWDGLAAGERPGMIVKGQLRVDDLEMNKRLAGKDMDNVGLAGCILRPTQAISEGVVIAGHGAAFVLTPPNQPNLLSNETLDSVSDLAVTRIGEDGSKQTVHPVSRQKEIYKDIPEHQQKIAGIRQFMEKCGFDGESFTAHNKRDMTGREQGVDFENHRFRMKFLPDSATNQLHIYDKQTHKIVSAAYSPDEDMLKISTTFLPEQAPLSSDDMRSVVKYQRGNRVVTHTTSERNDLDVVIYSMDQSMAGKLGMPKIFDRATAPNITLTKQEDGQYAAAITEGDRTMKTLASDDPRTPGTLAKYRHAMGVLNTMRAETSADGVAHLKFELSDGVRAIDVSNPDHDLDGVLRYDEKEAANLSPELPWYVNKTGAESTAEVTARPTSRFRRIAHSVGSLINRR